jgi:hypothetical protein
MGLRFQGITIWVVLDSSVRSAQWIAQEPISADTMVVLHWEETTLVSPSALGNARCEPPVPELAHWAQAILAFLGCWQALFDDLNIHTCGHCIVSAETVAVASWSWRIFAV